VASQQQHTNDGPAAAPSGPLGEARTLLPPAANDNQGRSIVRIAIACVAAAIALALGFLALHPPG